MADRPERFCEFLYDASDLDVMQDLFLYIVVSAVACLTPGSGVVFTVSSALRFGLPHAWRAPWGCTLGVAFMMLISALGLGGIVTASPILFYGLQTIGAFVLIYLGYQSWKASAVDLMQLDKTQDDKTHPTADKVIFQAALLQVTNPMLIVFLLSLLPQFVSPQEADYVLNITILSVLFTLICLVVHTSYSYAACLVGKFLRGERFAWWLNHVSAVLFWLIALSVFINFFTSSPV